MVVVIINLCLIFFKRKRFQSRLVAIGLALTACTSDGAQIRPYRMGAYHEASKRGNTIVLHFHDPHDLVSIGQKNALQDVFKKPEFKNIIPFRVNFQDEKHLNKLLHISRSATVIVFKGKSERGRLTGEVDPEKLAALIRAAL